MPELRIKIVGLVAFLPTRLDSEPQQVELIVPNVQRPREVHLDNGTRAFLDSHFLWLQCNEQVAELNETARIQSDGIKDVHGVRTDREYVSIITSPGVLTFEIDGRVGGDGVSMAWAGPPWDQNGSMHHLMIPKSPFTGNSVQLAEKVFAKALLGSGRLEVTACTEAEFRVWEDDRWRCAAVETTWFVDAEREVRILNGGTSIFSIDMSSGDVEIDLRYRELEDLLIFRSVIEYHGIDVDFAVFNELCAPVPGTLPASPPPVFANPRLSLCGGALFLPVSRTAPWWEG